MKRGQEERAGEQEGGGKWLRYDERASRKDSWHGGASPCPPLLLQPVINYSHSPCSSFNIHPPLLTLLFESGNSPLNVNFPIWPEDGSTALIRAETCIGSVQQASYTWIVSSKQAIERPVSPPPPHNLCCFVYSLDFTSLEALDKSGKSGSDH